MLVPVPPFLGHSKVISLSILKKGRWTGLAVSRLSRLQINETSNAHSEFVLLFQLPACRYDRLKMVIATCDALSRVALSSTSR
jgi:hypothetical protein